MAAETLLTELNSKLSPNPWTLQVEAPVADQKMVQQENLKPPRQAIQTESKQSTSHILGGKCINSSWRDRPHHTSVPQKKRQKATQTPRNSSMLSFTPSHPVSSHYCVCSSIVRDQYQSITQSISIHSPRHNHQEKCPPFIICSLCCVCCHAISEILPSSRDWNPKTRGGVMKKKGREEGEKRNVKTENKKRNKERKKKGIKNPWNRSIVSEWRYVFSPPYHLTPPF